MQSKTKWDPQTVLNTYVKLENMKLANLKKALQAFCQ